MASIEYLIRQPIANVFAAASLKRRSASTGLFESTWQDISEYVMKYGSIKSSIDDIKLNRFVQSGVNLTVRNNTGAFMPESNINSLWYSYLTRYRSLIKIDGGYYDSTWSKNPTDTTLGIFILSDEIEINSKNSSAILKCRSLVSIFDEVRAADITGITTTQTASDILTKIRDHTDGSGSLVFRQFISTSSWTIQTTTNNYVLSNNQEDLQNITAWELMTKLAESEGYSIYINRTGGVVFSDRNPNTGASQFSFYGQGFPRQNLISLDNHVESYNKYFNFVRLKFGKDDTTTSYANSGVVLQVDSSNTAWKYGSKTYQFENTFIPDTTTAQAVADALQADLSQIKTEVNMTAKFVPQLELFDRVDLSYLSYDLFDKTLWDQFNWDEANWDSEEGENFEFLGTPFKVISIQTNLDKFTTTFKLSQI